MESTLTEQGEEGGQTSRSLLPLAVCICGAESGTEMGPHVPSPTWVVSEKLPWLREWGSGSGKALGKPEIR